MKKLILIMSLLGGLFGFSSSYAQSSPSSIDYNQILNNSSYYIPAQAPYTAGPGFDLDCVLIGGGRNAGQLPSDFKNSCPAGKSVTAVLSSGSNQDNRVILGGNNVYVGDVGQGYICCGLGS